MYCPQLWVNYTKAMYSKLKIAYNNIFRRLLGYSKRDSASFMFASHNINNFDAVYRKNIYDFMRRVEASENTIMANIMDTDQKTGLMWHKWVSSLYLFNLC